jgi:hypothetical protein
MRHMNRLAMLPLLALLAAPAAAQQPEEIGPWRLVCAVDRMTDRADCRLRHRDPAEPGTSGRPGLVLELLDRGGRVVPAVTVRDLSLEDASRGLLAFTGTAQLRFPPNRLFEMPCGFEGRSLVCAPRAEDAQRASEELPRAASVLVRMQVTGGQGGGEPSELRLADTTEAIRRMRARMPEGSAAPPPPIGFETRDLMQRFQRLFGGQ